jgi:hypothetical protein
MNLEAESANNEGSNAKNRQKPPLKLTMNPRQNPPTREQCYKTGRNRHLKLTMNPEAESANNEGSNAKNRQPPLKLNNEPRGRIRQQRREQCYKTA